MENKEITIEDLTKPIVFVRKQIQRMGFLNTFWLKIIAIICMTIDHIGVSLGLIYDGGFYLSGFMSMDTYNSLRIIGRIAFPIFCYLIVEGLYHTKDVLNYIVRLLVFALISQIPFSLMTRRTPFQFRENLNVYFTLALGLITIAAIDYFKELQKKGIFNKPVFFITSGVIVLCLTTFADTIRTDYAGFGVWVIVIFYVFKDRPLLTFIALYLTTYHMSTQTELYALWAMVPILLHNHQKGPSLKYVFYLYYPLHMLVLYFISQAVI